LIEGIAMKLADFLKKNKISDPPDGTAGVESGWLEFTTLELTTGSLWSGDPFVCNASDGCVVKLPVGTYVLEAKVMEFAGRKRVSRLRVYREGAKQLSLGKKVGETCTDTGLIVVCDILELDRAVAGDHDTFQERVVDFDYKACGIVEFEMKKRPIRLPYFETGFGDCSPLVYSLIANRRRAGMELEILAPGYVYHDLDLDDDED
jgi:hypothetical protein